MRRAVFLLVVCGCASAGKSPPTSDTTPKQAVIYSSSGRPARYSPTAAAREHCDDRRSARVRMACREEGVCGWDIPLAVENTSTRQLGNQNFIKTRQVAGRSMTQLVDCGSGMTGPKAATYRIYMSLLTESSRRQGRHEAADDVRPPMGQDVAGGSTDRIPCGTTGRLEQLLLDQVAATVGKS